MGHTHTQKSFALHQKFKFTWVSSKSGDPTPREHLAMFGDIFGCQMEGVFLAYKEVEAKDAAYSVQDSSHKKESSSFKCQQCPGGETQI